MDSQQATDYDHLSQKYQWFGPEILFGLCYEFVRSDDLLLDIGIGTGLCSSLFFKLGLEIYGMDSSEEMLAVCQEKGIAKELKQWNLLNTPFPYSSDEFDIVVSGGVFHFFGDLQPIFRETARLTKSNGIFAFTTKTFSDELTLAPYTTGYVHGIPIFTHNDGYIHQLIDENGFHSCKEMRFFVLDDDGKDMLLKCYVTQRIGMKSSESK